MNDERLGQTLGSFYRDSDVTPPDARLSADRVMAEVRATPQVRRRWWLRALQDRSIEPTVASTVELHPEPSAASDGHSPTITGRTHAMFSPAKAIAAGALIFALGGVAFIAQPYGQPSGSVPGAATGIDPCTTPIVGVSGQILWGAQQPGGESIVVDGVTHLRNFTYRSTWQVDDDRLDGEQIFQGEWDFDGVAGVNRGAIRVENDEGAWEGLWTGIGASTDEWRGFISLTGEGAYDGLSASVFTNSGGSGPIEGSIYPTDIASCDFSSVQ